jgi:hypothetical protein
MQKRYPFQRTSAWNIFLVLGVNHDHILLWEEAYRFFPYFFNTVNVEDFDIIFKDSAIGLTG